jgi:hypothetical protein
VYSYIGIVLPLQCVYLGYDPIRIQPPHLMVEHLTRSIKQQEGGHAPHAVSGTQLAPDRAPGTQAQHLRLSRQVTL